MGGKEEKAEKVGRRGMNTRRVVWFNGVCMCTRHRGAAWNGTSNGADSIGVPVIQGAG